MKAGDHLVTSRTGYTHHGLYIGNGEVIHYSGGNDNVFSKGAISITSLREFSNGCGVSVKEHFFRTYDEEESIERAYSRLNEDWYNVLLNNCEHFVTWCIVGFHSSSQVSSMINGVALTYKAVKVAKASQTAQTLIGVVASRSLEREVVQFAASSGLKSAVSSSAGTVSGLVAGSSIASGTAATSATVGLVAGTSVTPLAPVVAAVAVGYGVKKIFDWFLDD